MGEMTTRYARAFAPGHVTGIFAPATEARDPRARGSRGAGVVLELGATAYASFRPGTKRLVRVTDDEGAVLPISEEVARRLAPFRPGTLSVHLAHELPVGQGFGMSAAGATATALAVTALSGRPRPEAIGVAHLADLFGGGGLGGVAAILGGGLELRVRPGIPPFGRVIHRPFAPAIWVGLVGGPIPTHRILSDPRALDRIVHAADDLNDLVRHPSSNGFLAASERFTDKVGLASAALRRTLTTLRRHGAWAAQAMFGQSFFAVAPTLRSRQAIAEWLPRSGIRAVELRPARRGALRSATILTEGPSRPPP